MTLKNSASKKGVINNMGELIHYMCQKCDFTIEDHDLKYFIDEKTNCIVIHSTGMLTFDMGRDSKINGKIIPSFCPHCLEEVNFCHNDDGENVEKIISSLETDENEFKDYLDEKYVLRNKNPMLKGAVGPKNEYGECPKCGRKLELITGDSNKCPKCGGMLFGFLAALYD